MRIAIFFGLLAVANSVSPEATDAYMQFPGTDEMGFWEGILFSIIFLPLLFGDFVDLFKGWRK